MVLHEIPAQSVGAGGERLRIPRPTHGLGRDLWGAFRLNVASYGALPQRRTRFIDSGFRAASVGTRADAVSACRGTVISQPPAIHRGLGDAPADAPRQAAQSHGG